MTEQFANNASTTLNGAINNSITTVVVTNGSVFSQSGTFRVIVDSEIMLVSAISGNTLTVARGQEGTSAVSHLTAATITQIVTAAGLAQFKLDTSVGVMHSSAGDPNTYPSFVQGNSSSGLSTTTSIAVTTGQLLVAFIATEGVSLGSIPTDSIGTTYTLVDSITGASLNAAVYVGIAPSSAIVTLTGTQTNTFPRTSIAVCKNATTTIDNFAHVIGAATVNVTVSVTNSLVLGLVAYFHSAASFTPGTGFTANVTGTGSDATFIESLLALSTGTQAVAYTGNSGPATSDLFGIVIHPASAPPTVGQDGDFYIDTFNKKLYGPRTSGVYPLIGTLT